MKIEIDQKKLKDIMQTKGIKNLKHLAVKCGIPLDMLYKAYQRKSLSKECLWLISEELDCSINDFVVPNWEKE